MNSLKLRTLVVIKDSAEKERNYLKLMGEAVFEHFI